MQGENWENLLEIEQDNEFSPSLPFLFEPHFPFYTLAEMTVLD
jgi:hypothetical protein